MKSIVAPFKYCNSRFVESIVLKKQMNWKLISKSFYQIQVGNQEYLIFVEEFCFIQPQKESIAYIF